MDMEEISQPKKQLKRLPFLPFFPVAINRRKSLPLSIAGVLSIFSIFSYGSLYLPFASLKALAEATHAPPSDPDYLVIAGRSCGKIALGMSKDDVIKVLGQPTKKLPPEAKQAPEIWSYDARDQWLHLLFGGNRVAQIDFTSPSFKTEEGFGTDLKNVSDNSVAFAASEIAEQPDHMRYQYRKGGFSIYVLSAGNGEDDPSGRKIACIYRGSRPVLEAYGLPNEPNAGWKPSKANPEAPLGVQRLSPNTTTEKDLGGGYSYCQHTDARGVVTSAELFHAKKAIHTISSNSAAIMPLQADSKGVPASKDLDGDGVPDLAILLFDDINPPRYLLQVIPLKGDDLAIKFTQSFFGKKPVLMPALKSGQLGVLGTDDTYVYSFGDESNSPEPLIRVRWTDRGPLQLSVDEMKKPPLTQDENYLDAGQDSKDQPPSRTASSVFPSHFYRLFLI